MTTPRDAISGLSERLKAWGSSDPCFLIDHIRTQMQEGCIAAATQLDSLLKERDALQARVKELEASNRIAKQWQRWAEDERAIYEPRALLAEQERDEAVTSTRYKIFDNLLGAYIGAEDGPVRVAIGNLAYTIFPEHRNELRKVAEVRRLSAGPEKDHTP